MTRRRPYPDAGAPPPPTHPPECGCALCSSHWTPAQRVRVAELYANGWALAYWCSDAHGRPVNGGRGVTASPGAVHVGDALRPVLCVVGTLHATYEPHRWQGVRVWVVALEPPIATSNEKLGALRREVIGEVLPEEALCPSVAVRLGRVDCLDGANLDGASLVRASLDGARLVGANLDGANLVEASLIRANLDGASLVGANLDGANLDGASLVGAKWPDLPAPEGWRTCGASCRMLVRALP